MRRSGWRFAQGLFLVLFFSATVSGQFSQESDAMVRAAIIPLSHEFRATHQPKPSRKNRSRRISGCGPLRSYTSRIGYTFTYDNEKNV